MNQFCGTAGLLQLMIEVCLDMNIVKTNPMACFWLVGLGKQLYHRFLPVLLKVHP